MDAVLQVRLLGGVQIHWCGRLLAGFNAARLQVLLAYLLLHRQAPIERSKMAFLLWPDSSEAQAQTNLRRELHALREALPEADRFVDSAGRTLHWRADAPATVDLIDFETSLAAASAAEARREATAARTCLEQAIMAYGGDLLPARYEDFILSERERLRNKCLGALEQLAELCATGRDYPNAIRWNEEILRLEPLRESTCRKLMQLHERSGNRGGALQAYRALAERLQRELQAAPDPSSEALFRSILARSAPTPPSREEGSRHIPLIGRTAEWEQLHEAWRHAQAKPSRMVLIRGDAGVGKTRLSEEMLTWAARHGIPAARSHCYAAEGSLNYGPVVEWLGAPALRRDWESLDAIWLGELSRLFPELPTGDWHPELLREAWQRHRFFEAMARAVAAGDRRLLLIDDLQWCDAGTTEWLHFLLRFKCDTTLLLVATLRDTDLDPAHLVQTLISELRIADQLTEIALVPLNATDTAALASAVAERGLSNAEAVALYQQTQGWPLFVVEAMRAASLMTPSQRAAGQAPPAGETTGLPPKVHAVISRRLASLPHQTREFAEWCAAYGRGFRLDLIRKAISWPEADAATCLDELWRRGMMRQSGHSLFDFSHDIIREVAYTEISPARRLHLHRRLAEALIASGEAIPAETAYHLDRAGDLAGALREYQVAGEEAVRLCANRRAMHLLGRALALLAESRAGPERDATELRLLSTLGVATVAVDGYGAAEVSRIYSRANALAGQTDWRLRAPVLRAFSIAHLVRGDLDLAERHGEELLELAGQGDDRVVDTEAHYVLGVTAFWRGNFALARKHLDYALEACAPEPSPLHLALYAQDPAAICGSRLAYALWFLGLTESASTESQRAINRARRIEHPFSLAYALNFAAWLADDQGNSLQARALAGELAAISDGNELGHLRPMSRILLGYFDALEGSTDSIARIEEGIRAYLTTEQRLYHPYALALLARAQARLGLSALASLDEALAAANRTGERFYSAELLRLKGECLLPSPAAAAELFSQSAALARAQGSPILELRALMCLESLVPSPKARKRIASLLSHSPEQLDPPDLARAESLLK